MHLWDSCKCPYYTVRCPHFRGIVLYTNLYYVAGKLDSVLIKEVS